MRTNVMNKCDIFPAMAGFPEAVSDVTELPQDTTVVRLVSRPKNLPLLARLSHLERLWCFDLNAKNVHILGALTSLRRLYVDGVRIDGFGALAGLTRLEVLSLERGTRIESLEHLEPFRRLHALGITHFPKVHSLKPLNHFESLKALVIAGGMWSRMSVESLSPLSSLSSLRYLHLSNLKALDESLEPLASLTGLETLELPNFYSVEEFAKLSVHLKNTSCTWFASFIPLGSWTHCTKCGNTRMVMLTGKGTLVLCASCDEDRLRKHDELFKNIAARAA